MTDLEKLQAELDKANEANNSLSDKNKQILDEKKKLERKCREVNLEDFQKLQDDFDKLDSEHNKLVKANGALSKDLEKQTNLVAEKDGSLSKLLVDDGIAKALNGLDKFKLNDGALELATLDIKNKGVELIDGVPMIGDKSMSDYISADWLESSSSKNLVTPNENSGGGAGGGSGEGATQKRSTMSLCDKGAFIAEHGNDAYLALPN